MKDFIIGGYNRDSQPKKTLLQDDDVADFEVEHEMKTIKKLPAELLDQEDEEFKDDVRATNQRSNSNIDHDKFLGHNEISIIQGK